MRRFAVAASILAMLASVVPAAAGGEQGRVRFPTASPAYANALWAAKVRSNGIVGWVFRLDPSADGATYELVTTGGLTGVENVDAYFYEDLPDGSGPGAICPVAVKTERIRSESGTICPGPQVAAWGIVVLTTGADARFSLTWQPGGGPPL